MSNPAGLRSTASIQSVDRAVSIMELLASQGAARVTDLAGALGIHKSTAFRILSTLEARGLVDQDGDRGLYRLGFGIVRLAGATTAQLDLSQESRAVCERLAHDLGETVNVAVLDQGWATNISQVRGRPAIASHNWVGQRTPLHATSSGKVLLAFQPDAEREAVVSGELERFTDHTITDSEELRKVLADVRAQGWASTSEELEVGLNAVAAPIRGQDGGVVAAISVSGPTYRMASTAFPDLTRRVVAEAAAISARLGHLG